MVQHFRGRFLDAERFRDLSKRHAAPVAETYHFLVFRRKLLNFFYEMAIVFPFHLVAFSDDELVEREVAPLRFIIP